MQGGGSKNKYYARGGGGGGGEVNLAHFSTAMYACGVSVLGYFLSICGPVQCIWFNITHIEH